MYNRLLENVVTVIKSTTELMDTSKQDSYSDFYNALFAPEIHQEQLERQMRRRKIRDGLIAGATGLAVIGELYHIGRRTEILKKISKR